MSKIQNRVSLQKRIVIMITGVTVLMLSVMMAVDSVSLNKSIRQAYVSQISGMTIAINGRYEESRSISDVQQIFDYIKYKNDKVLELKMYNEQGEILASSRRDEIGTKLPGLKMKLPQDKPVVDRLPMEENDKPVVRLTAPMQVDGQVVGAVEVILDSTEETALLNNRTKIIFAVGITVAVLLSALLWLILRRIVIIPLTKLREAALHVMRGGKLEKLEFYASPEIEVVSEAFNDMVTNLEERYEELQQALNTLKKTQDQLIQSEKMSALGSLVAGVSHEINTPIGVGVTAVSYLDQKARFFQDLYQSGKMKKSDLEQFLSVVLETNTMVQSNLERASSLIRSFKQISSDQSVEEKRSFHLLEYLEGIVVSLKPTLKKTRLRVHIECSDKLELYSFPGAISQIITNLVMNSLNHAFEPEEEGNLTIRVESEDRRVKLFYSDDGRGMRPDVLEKIFDPFFTTSRGKGGTGLGMNIVYNLVTQTLGGTIECCSVVGRGSLFHIEIPVEEESLR
ncbi:sensor histidine kinase [Paenibacillus hexagrammi]|uniref:histidine kinase n=1 Tax=Paenibacillus hexagrammi TaxID=2908839 RepID=A0ABY3SRH0_9BACL|nr:HAMP domain-containing sensor histidine kinase [Paenibacillus sp. YPD9-1]UJF35859.1 HAMP domain-containing histidine kinase [Paenibacillus sp. YPD9-1]